MKVKHLKSHLGNPVPNHFTIEHNGIIYFQSYDVIVACIRRGITYLDRKYWDYSPTTARYRNEFLRLKNDEVKAKVASG